jgi:hypothetical protein
MAVPPAERRAMTAVAAKVLGALLCVLFLLTLKPLLQLAASLIAPSIRPAFLQEVENLGEASHVPTSVAWALMAGTVVCLTVAAALTSIAGEASIVIGAACGFLILYPYFFLVLYERARHAAPQLTNERRTQ